MTMRHLALKQKLAAVEGAVLLEADHGVRGFHIDLALAPEQLLAAVSLLDAEGFFIEAITGVDWLGEQAALAKEAAAKAAAEAKARAEAAAAAGEGPEAPEAPVEVQGPQGDTLEAVYDFNHYEGLCRVVLRVRTPREKPEIPSISAIYPGADWHERETHDFFGIVFTGHPHLVPLLLPEDADFHPLLKDFAR